ncbi:MAG: hypothetical protein ACNA7L_09995 [Roseinatronobacter sp.]
MDIVIDLAIALGAIIAAAYCLLLSRRLRALTRLDGDVGRAIAVLSKQVDDLTTALRAAEQQNSAAGTALGQQITQAEAAARRLELLMAAAQTSRQNAPSHLEGAQDIPAYGTDHAAFAPMRPAAPRSQDDLRRRVIRQRDHAGVSR